MKLLLDTKEFLLFITGSPSLSEQVRSIMEDETNEVFVSVISYWEISVKYRLGKLPLDDEPHRYVPDTLKRHGFTDLPLIATDVAEYHKLPLIHRDPFDRMLICQALARGLTLVTSDSLILQYPVPVL